MAREKGTASSLKRSKARSRRRRPSKKGLRPTPLASTASYAVLVQPALRLYHDSQSSLQSFALNLILAILWRLLKPRFLALASGSSFASSANFTPLVLSARCLLSRSSSPRPFIRMAPSKKCLPLRRSPSFVATKAARTRRLSSLQKTPWLAVLDGFMTSLRLVRTNLDCTYRFHRLTADFTRFVSRKEGYLV